MKVLLLSIILALFPVALSAQGTLILGVDMSASIDKEELILQMNGYSETLRNFPYLKDVNVVTLLFDTELDVVASGDIKNTFDFFNNFDIDKYINDAHIDTSRSMTCTHLALEYVLANIETYHTPVIVDISTDGFDNCDYNGSIMASMKLEDLGVQINTIVIGTEQKEMLDFNESIATNKMYIAKDFYDFEYVLYEKLQMEVAQLK